MATARRPWDTVVVGTGPGGLVAALAAARQGTTLLVARRIPSDVGPPRIDAVPAPLLALLLEVGVHPATIGARELHDTRLMAWESEEPEVIRGRATAHVARPALENALAAAVGQTPGIEIATADGAAAVPVARRVIDATGRSALSARRRVGPPEPWIARTFWTEGTFTTAAQAFRIAALPDGYAYRLGSGTRIVLGIVGGKAAARRTPDEIERHLRAFRGGWLLAGVPAPGAMKAGRGGAASLQWSEGGETAASLRVGDAALARDALASQGLATGISDAFQLATGEKTPGPDWTRRQREQRDRHVSALLAVVASCRFRDFPAWSGYADFLAASAQAKRA